MAHHKRRKRKRFGVKGHCTMCASQIRQGGLRNKRMMGMQERRANPTRQDVADVERAPTRPPPHPN